MTKVLVVYATTLGQTRKIAWRAARRLAERDVEACIVDAGDPPPGGVDPAGYDAVILAASVHRAVYQEAALEHVRANVEALNAAPSAFVSVSLYAYPGDAEDEEDARDYARAFLAQTGWRPAAVHHAAGAVRFRGDVFERWTAKVMARDRGLEAAPGEDIDLTDWDALDAFVDDFARLLASR